MALICVTTLPSIILVGWHDCTGEGRARARLEVRSEQILEVVASLLCACGGGFILLIEGSDAALLKGRRLDSGAGLPCVATRPRPRRGGAVTIFRARSAPECHVETEHQAGVEKDGQSPYRTASGLRG